MTITQTVYFTRSRLGVADLDIVPITAKLTKYTDAANDVLYMQLIRSDTVGENGDVQVGDEIIFYIKERAADYSLNATYTAKFGGVVRAIKAGQLKEVFVDSFGASLNNIWVDDRLDTYSSVDLVYDAGATEGLIQRIITEYTDLTFSSTTASGVTLDKFRARGKVADILRQIAEILDWTFWTDSAKNFYFTPKSTTVYTTFQFQAESAALTSGLATIATAQWNKDYTGVYNHILLLGGEISYTEEEYFTGDNSTKTFSLSREPHNARVKIWGQSWDTGTNTFVRDATGSEVWNTIEHIDSGDGEVWSIDTENKELVFVVAPSTEAGGGATPVPSPATGNVLITYDYWDTVFVDMEDSTSIIAYGRSSIQLTQDGIRDYEDAEDYARQYLSEHAEPKLTGKITFNFYPLNFSDGIYIDVKDEQHGINSFTSYVVKRVVWSWPQGRVSAELDYPEPLNYSWQGRVDEKLRNLEKRLANAALVRKYISPVEGLTVDETFSGDEVVYTSGTDVTSTAVNDIITRYPLPIDSERIYVLRDAANPIVDEVDTTNNATGTSITYSQSIADASKGIASTRCLGFNGSTSFIEVPEIDLLNTANTSFSIWIYPLILSGQQRIIYTGSALSTNELDVNWSTDNINIVWNNNTDVYSGSWSFPASTRVNHWTKITITYDGTSVRAYEDNTLKLTIAGSGAGYAGSPGQLFLGSFFGTFDFFNGYLSDFRVYSKKLEAGDIANIYRQHQLGGEIYPYRFQATNEYDTYWNFMEWQ